MTIINSKYLPEDNVYEIARTKRFSIVKFIHNSLAVFGAICLVCMIVSFFN